MPAGISADETGSGQAPAGMFADETGASDGFLHLLLRSVHPRGAGTDLYLSPREPVSALDNVSHRAKPGGVPRSAEEVSVSKERGETA